MRFATFVLTLFQDFHIHMRILRLNHSSVSSKKTFHIGKMIITCTHPFWYSFSFCFLLAYPHPLLRLVSSFNLDFILAWTLGAP